MESQKLYKSFNCRAYVGFGIFRAFLLHHSIPLNKIFAFLINKSFYPHCHTLKLSTFYIQFQLLLQLSSFSSSVSFYNGRMFTHTKIYLFFLKDKMLFHNDRKEDSSFGQLMTPIRVFLAG